MTDRIDRSGYRRLRIPDVIAAVETFFAERARWDDEAKVYRIQAVRLSHFNLPEELRKGTALNPTGVLEEVAAWIESGITGVRGSVPFGQSVEFELGFGQGWSLDNREDPPIWIEKLDGDAELDCLCDAIRGLDATGFGWQKKERFLAVLLGRARVLGCAGPVETLRETKSIRQVIEAGRAADRA